MALNSSDLAVKQKRKEMSADEEKTSFRHEANRSKAAWNREMAAFPLTDKCKKVYEQKVAKWTLLKNTDMPKVCLPRNSDTLELVGDFLAMCANEETRLTNLKIDNREQLMSLVPPQLDEYVVLPSELGEEFVKWFKGYTFDDNSQIKSNTTVAEEQPLEEYYCDCGKASIILDSSVVFFFLQEKDSNSRNYT